MHHICTYNVYVYDFVVYFQPYQVLFCCFCAGRGVASQFFFFNVNIIPSTTPDHTKPVFNGGCVCLTPLMGTSRSGPGTLKHHGSIRKVFQKDVVNLTLWDFLKACFSEERLASYGLNKAGTIRIRFVELL